METGHSHSHLTLPLSPIDSILSQCCECTAYDNEWASISYGILLCLDCAGRHRSLGVQISYVKSLYLDTWSIEQVRKAQSLSDLTPPRRLNL
jgi:ADP-ribosylation factor GTPase-activating protein 1